MATEVVTLDDLNAFKSDLINEIKCLINGSEKPKDKKWLKSAEVRKMLNVSRGTLLNLRVNGTLPFSKVGGVVYYDFDDIKKAMTDSRRCNR